MKVFKNLFGTNDKIHGNVIALNEGGSYKTLEEVLDGLIKVETITAAQATVDNGAFYAKTIDYIAPAGYKIIGYTVGFSSPIQSAGYYHLSNKRFMCYYNNNSGASRTGIPFVSVTLAKTDYVDGELMY